MTRRVAHTLPPEMMEALERSADETHAWLDCMWGIIDASGRSARVCALARYFAEAETADESNSAEAIREKLDDYDDATEEAVLEALCPGITKLEEHLASALADAAVRAAKELGHPKPETLTRKDACPD
jgi:hypothetical protein